MNKFRATLLASLAGLAVSSVVFAAVMFKAHAFEYDPGNTHTVVGRWVKDLGLADGGNDYYGLLLSKNAVTSTNSAPGATIKGVKNIQLTELGFDIRNGGHCGAGAPRFNVVTNDNVLHYVGCVYAANGVSPDPGWQRKFFNTAALQDGTKVYPPLLPGNTVKTIDLIMDEGTDTGPDNSGLAILDNININGSFIKGPQ